jgi:two-component system chemotaxis response regulator CheY
LGDQGKEEMMAPTVLIVDDALFMRMMIRDILSKDGFDVVAEAENGVEAVERFKEVRPDLVTMDIVMPEMDGIEAVKQIMKIDPNAKILMCSAMGQQPLVVEALEAGAKDFIIKPFQPSKVIEAVEKALKE